MSNKLSGIVAQIKQRCGQITYAIDPKTSSRYRALISKAILYWEYELSHELPADNKAIFAEKKEMAAISIRLRHLKKAAAIYRWIETIDKCPRGVIDIATRSKSWSDNTIESVIRHEIGHVLGLGHSDEGTEDVMDPSIICEEEQPREASPEQLRLLWTTLKPLWLQVGKL